jgi:hypothetical protein
VLVALQQAGCTSLLGLFDCVSVANHKHVGECRAVESLDGAVVFAGFKARFIPFLCVEVVQP